MAPTSFFVEALFLDVEHTILTALQTVLDIHISVQVSPGRS